MIRRPDRDDVNALEDLFTSIDGLYFHPHALDRAGAEEIAGYRGRDVYLVAWEDARAVAFGILRGWDEGYEVPSLGLAVRGDREHRGYGLAMMITLAVVARDRGARRIRIWVHVDNARARRLYEQLGYREAGEERGERLMFLDL